MEKGDPRIELLGNIKYENVQVDSHPQIIFFCGGPVPNDVISCPPFYSARHFMSHHLSFSSDLKIINAESIKEWNHYAIYPNLIDFELDLAKICKLIVLFVESPGSLVELGVFSAKYDIAKKLIVFIQDKFNNKDSFIEHGPVQYLNTLDDEPDRVYWYEWEFDSDSYLIPQSIEVEKQNILEDIADKFKRIKSDDISNDSLSWISLVICDLIYLFKAVIITELKDYLLNFSINLTNKQLNQYLFCLCKLELIIERKKSNVSYYLPCVDARRFLRLPLKSGKLDSVRLGAKVTEFYLKFDGKRSRVISKVAEEQSEL